MKNESEMNDLTHRVIGCAIEVHRRLGVGFLESTYEKALSIELRLAGIKHELQKKVALTYRDEPIGDGRVDLFVEDCLIVKLKAVKTLHDGHTTQVLSYLKATNLPLALILNFHAQVLTQGVKRVIN